MTGETSAQSSADARAKAQAQAKFLEGWACHQRGEMGPAWAHYQQAIALNPHHFDALHLAGIIAAQARFLDQSVDLIARAVAVDPRNVAAHYNLGNALGDLGRLEDAVASYDKAIALDPSYPDPHNNRGNILWRLKRHGEAVESYEKAIALKPDYAEAYNNRGNALRDKGDREAAAESFARAIALKPDFAEAHNNRGNVLRDLGQHHEAVESYARAIHFKPDFAEAYSNRGNALRDLKRLDDALASYEHAIAIKPEYADAYYNRGVALRILKRPKDAVESYTHAIRLRPDHAEAYKGRGLAYVDMKKFTQAVEDISRAIALKPDYAEAYFDRGVALSDMKQNEGAVADYDKAIALKPDYPEAYNNRGVALKDLRRDDEALASYDRALVLKEDSAETHNNRGILLADLRRHEEAIASYARAFALKPDYAFVLGALIHSRMHICDWWTFEADVAELVSRIEAGAQVTSPFNVLALVDRPAVQRKAAETWTRAEFPRNTMLGPMARTPVRGRKIRIGYFSMDFRNHPTGLLIIGALEAHDKSRFETHAFSFGPDTQDWMRKRMEATFDKFFDVRTASDVEIATLAREVGLDIAIDLAGYTSGARTGIFALGAAPLQVNYLGYPGSMGSAYYDYILADPVVVPDDERHNFSEKVVQLPHSYQANDMSRRIADTTPSRAELGLPDNAFVFCSFNNNFKITPGTFGGWMRILARVPGSVLWLFEDNAAAGTNLRKEAGCCGIDPARLIFAPRVPHADHLARHRAADLFLDTLPYNAHTTASDALWTGLPLLTCLGKSFPARVAGSILTALELPQLITSTPAEFEDRAVALAHDPALLAEIRAKLEHNRLSAPLYNARLFARHIEDAYTQMVARLDAGLMPEHIKVAP